MREAVDSLTVEYTDGPADLRVVRQVPPPGSVSCSATFVAPAGWARDPTGAAGMARVASQLVTSGAGRRRRRELARFLDGLGATLAAHADPESAEITVWGPSAEWRVLLGVLADTVLRPRFEAADLARVHRQMLERQMRELSQPGSRVEREMLRALFPRDHPYRETGTGDPQTLRRVTAEKVRAFHRDHFTGPGSTLVVTVPASTRDVRREAGRRFAELPSAALPALEVPPVGRPRPREIRIPLPGRSQVELRLAGASLRRTDESYPAAYLANEVLGGASMLSRLFARVRSRGGLAYHASSSLEAMRWGGYWSAQAGSGGDRWQKVVPMLREEVARLSGANIPLSELETVRESRIGELQLALESTGEAHELAVEVAYYGLPDDQWARWPAELRALTPRDVRRAAERVFDLDRSVSALAGPLDGP